MCGRTKREGGKKEYDIIETKLTSRYFSLVVHRDAGARKWWNEQIGNYGTSVAMKSRGIVWQEMCRSNCIPILWEGMTEGRCTKLYS